MDQLLGLSEPWAYLLIGALAAAEASAFVGLFLPGEAAMLLGGVLAYQGRVSLGLMIVAGCIGSIVGDSIGYEIGRHLGPATTAPIASRRRRLCGRTTTCVRCFQVQSLGTVWRYDSHDPIRRTPRMTRSLFAVSAEVSAPLPVPRCWWGAR